MIKLLACLLVLSLLQRRVLVFNFVLRPLTREAKRTDKKRENQKTQQQPNSE